MPSVRAVEYRKPCPELVHAMVVIILTTHQCLSLAGTIGVSASACPCTQRARRLHG